MIVQSAPPEEPRFVITMAQHMTFAGQLARAFGNDDFEPVEPREAVLYIVDHHDAGWADLDAEGRIDPATGLPYNLVQTPFSEIVKTSAASPAFNSRHHAYCGLLSSMHSWGLYNGRYGMSDHVLLDSLAAENRATAEGMLNGELERQARLKHALAENPDTAAWVDEAQVMQNYKQLQFFDTMALYFNCNGAADREPKAFTHVPMSRHRGRHHRAHPARRSHLRARSLPVRGRRARGFLRGAIHGAAPGCVECRSRRGRRGVADGAPCRRLRRDDRRYRSPQEGAYRHRPGSRTSPARGCRRVSSGSSSSTSASPELDLGSVDLSTRLFGRRLKAPLLISSMTGGTARARDINRNLAAAAESLGIAMGVGSQRAMIEKPALAESYRVRDVAPDILLFANFGAVQLNHGYGPDDARRAVETIGADALFLHFNPLQEAVQAGGDRDWTGLYRKVESLAASLDVPIVGKEVGNGIGAAVAARLVDCGLAAVDVSGAGGTSWSEVEAYRQPDPEIRAVAHSFAGWGIPTAAALIDVVRAIPHRPVFASGGIRDGIDAAKAIRLGAVAGRHRRADAGVR